MRAEIPQRNKIDKQQNDTKLWIKYMKEILQIYALLVMRRKSQDHRCDQKSALG